MRPAAAITRALAAAGIEMPIAGTRDLSGGRIHRVMEITLGDGRRVIAKVNDAHQLALFEEEAHSLRALAATRTVLVPQPLAAIAHADRAVLLMTAIEPAAAAPTEAAWRGFGADLAALHLAHAGARYGFAINNHIGSTIQSNSWNDDWVEFNAVNRIGFQVKMACDGGLLNAAEVGAMQRVIDRLDRFIPRRPKPALLHGDLWSGNALPAVNDRIALIDPACSIGDCWADVAMMRLFSGFPDACFDAYAARIDDRDQIDERIAVYQIYHLLNHVNIFGRAYAGQALALAQRLGA